MFWIGFAFREHSHSPFLLWRRAPLRRAAAARGRACLNGKSSTTGSVSARSAVYGVALQHSHTHANCHPGLMSHFTCGISTLTRTMSPPGCGLTWQGVEGLLSARGTGGQRSRPPQSTAADVWRLLGVLAFSNSSRVIRDAQLFGSELIFDGFLALKSSEENWNHVADFSVYLPNEMSCCKAGCGLGKMEWDGRTSKPALVVLDRC